MRVYFYRNRIAVELTRIGVLVYTTFWGVSVGQVEDRVPPLVILEYTGKADTRLWERTIIDSYGIRPQRLYQALHKSTGNLNPEQLGIKLLETGNWRIV